MLMCLLALGCSTSDAARIRPRKDETKTFQHLVFGLCHAQAFRLRDVLGDAVQDRSTSWLEPALRSQDNGLKGNTGSRASDLRVLVGRLALAVGDCSSQKRRSWEVNW